LPSERSTTRDDIPEDELKARKSAGAREAVRIAELIDTVQRVLATP
jgi:hypothetical protein